MPADNAYQFLERVANDASLRAQFRSAGSATIQATMDFALTKGFVFTEQDLRAAVATFPDNTTIDQLRDTWKIAKGARST